MITPYEFYGGQQTFTGGPATHQMSGERMVACDFDSGSISNILRLPPPALCSRGEGGPYYYFINEGQSFYVQNSEGVAVGTIYANFGTPKRYAAVLCLIDSTVAGGSWAGFYLTGTNVANTFGNV